VLQHLVAREGADKLRAALAATPNPHLLATRVSRVVIRGRHALVVFEADGQRMVEHLQQDRGAWRVR
jgi:hypothetical protein